MKSTVFSVIIAVSFIGGALLLSKDGPDSSREASKTALIENGRQIVEIEAGGGYSPKLTNAKANMPTIIKVKTNGAFDCSSALTIPALGYSTSLPLSGVTEIPVPPQKPETTLQGICSMGMYGFSVNFQ